MNAEVKSTTKWTLQQQLKPAAIIKTTAIKILHSFFYGLQLQRLSIIIR